MTICGVFFSTVAKERCSFHSGYTGSNASRGAADIRGGEQVKRWLVNWYISIYNVYMPLIKLVLQNVQFKFKQTKSETANIPLIYHVSLPEQLCLPRRVFCLLKGAGSLCVCDYQFNDEGPGEVTDRLKEMLDIDAAEEDLDTRQELNAEMVAHVVETGWKNCVFISNGCIIFLSQL